MCTVVSDLSVQGPMIAASCLSSQPQSDLSEQGPMVAASCLSAQPQSLWMRASHGTAECEETHLQQSLDKHILQVLRIKFLSHITNLRFIIIISLGIVTRAI